MGLVGRPELLFLDETTILLTTHDLNEAEKLADRVIILNGGRIVADGTVEELAQRIAGEDEVRWMYGGRRFVQSTSDSTTFARKLFAQYGEAISELEVRRASLEDTYLALARQAESNRHDADAPGQEGAA